MKHCQVSVPKWTQKRKKNSGLPRFRLWYGMSRGKVLSSRGQHSHADRAPDCRGPPMT
ncbi:hypothetical protein CD178_03455 (plasmid) [Komagataeibacter saccharivorans]|uniref:Uncharacterized protein n=1 Tax=Komagataeibacter saccharivorans TaxID=265959 RepID=A0A347WH56_9PROT|nr:hypothetical protein CD178_03455 [Komagataeibacter saccharivorans]